jgi:hypothetical protein
MATSADTTNLSRRAILGRAPAAALATAIPALAVADPVFAAIAEHKRYYDATWAFPVDEDGPEFQTACNVEERYLQGLAYVAPSTVGGAAALLEYMIEREGEVVDDLGSPFLQTVRTVAAALRSLNH